MDTDMSDASKSIKKGLEEALAHAKGKKTGARVHRIKVPEPDVAAIRARSGLSQAEFARSIGVAVGTLRGWEQGRRRPEGPARVLLALIQRRPGIVQDELRT
jgi:putative transcriptional regulator